jgi:phage shock protein E
MISAYQTKQWLGNGIMLTMLTAGTACSLAPTAVTTPTLVSQTELLEATALDDSPLILDVRASQDYQQGHIPGAINIDSDELPDQLDTLPRDRPIVVYCEVGRRTRIATNLLVEAGFSDVRQLEGDMQEWRSNEQPIVTPDQ